MADQDTRYIDPLFLIPEGMDERVWKEGGVNEVSVNGEGGLGAEGDADSDVSIFDTTEITPAMAPPPPVENLNIISQVLRRGSDGSMVVDVVVEVDDIPGVSKYEFRLTKY